jgi:hypothetical protein
MSQFFINLLEALLDAFPRPWNWLAVLLVLAGSIGAIILLIATQA